MPKRRPTTVEIEQMARIADKSKDKFTRFPKFDTLVGKKEKEVEQPKPIFGRAKTIIGVMKSNPFEVQRDKNRARARTIMKDKR